jgi:hypothetical protein
VSLAAFMPGSGATRRRPGFAFEAVAPALPAALPRMDVALFAGIAERGPVNVPVAVEDLAQFEGRFGGPAPLVLDPARGEIAKAQLHGAVSLFFANGGRRCWVLRVAGESAEASRFAVPGVCALRVDDKGSFEVEDAVVHAASAGRWADGLQVASSLEVDRAVAVTVSPQALELAPGGAPDWVPGDLLRLSWPALTAWAAVAAVERGRAGSVAPVRVRLEKTSFAAVAGSPPGMVVLAAWPEELPSVECLRLTLWWRDGTRVQRLSGLGLGPGHPRHLLRLPDDAALEARPDAHIGAMPDAAARLRRTWADALSPRVPVAGAVGPADAGLATWCLPVAVSALPAAWAGAAPSTHPPIERDGLLPWTAALFADPALAASPAATLASDAESLRVHSRDPRALKGLHAAWPIDEISMVAAPDAGWPGWVLDVAPSPDPVPDPMPETAPPPGFAACASATEPPARAPAVAPGSGQPVWQLRRASSGLAGRATLLAVQRLMLRWVLARGDAVALLSLPAGAEAAEALSHRERLLRAVLTADDGVPALLGAEHAALGLAVLVHGGVVLRSAEGRLLRRVADGAVAGLVARRTLARGAWIAPANEALRGVVALADEARPAATGALLDARVNVLATTPRGLLPLNADTLGPGPVEDLRALGARRLLQLLRRLALREGQTWTFEPHDSAFRRGVQRSLEALMRGLFERGAFAGRRPEDGFQVVAASEALNNRASVDAGRFIVELRVAPAEPMVFVTIRLVRHGDGLTVD